MICVFLHEYRYDDISVKKWRNLLPNRREADDKWQISKRCFVTPVSLASLTFQYRFSCDCVMTYCQSIKQTSQWRSDLLTSDSTFRLIERIRKCRLNSHRRASLRCKSQSTLCNHRLKFHLHATGRRTRNYTIPIPIVALSKPFFHSNIF